MQIHESILTYQTLKPVKGFWRTIRRNGAEKFKVLGMPGKHLEAWHYTSLKSIQDRQLLPALDRSGALSSAELLKNYSGKDFYHLVFVNGEFQPKLSSAELLSKDLATKIKISKVGDKISSQIFSEVKKYRQRCAEFHQDAMEALNSAFSDFGAVIEIKKNAVIEKPLQILNIKTTSTALYPKFLVIADKFSKFSMVELHVSEFSKGVTDSWQNSCFEMVLSEGAHGEFIRIQVEDVVATHVSSSRFYLDRNSKLETLSISAGAKLGRNDLSVHLVGEGAEAQVNGMTISGGHQHLDNKTLIDHAVGQCTTTQLYKSVLGGHSRSVFTGRVHIKQDAQKANSEQLNQNLLLSSSAEANSKPELGIYADDVKASHGSTIGQISKEEIFYLQSRAISKEAALELLSFGFVQELVDKVSHQKIKQWLTLVVAQQFKRVIGELS